MVEIKKPDCVSNDEAKKYVEYLEKKHNRKLSRLNIKVDEDFVDLDYDFIPVGIERIRRITGYLVGDMKHWNSAKSAEERDRVSHMNVEENEIETL